MAALAKVAIRNLVQAAVLDEGVWLASLPLDNVKDASRYVGAPARCPTPADLSASKLRATLPSSKAVSLIALLFHNLSLAAKYRVTIAGDDGNLATPIWESGWVTVYPIIYGDEELVWEDDNFWTGQLAEEDLDLVPRHLWIPLPAEYPTTAIRIELDDTTNPDGFIDIGGLLLARPFSTEMNFDRGRELAAIGRTLTDEAPSGRRLHEQRRSRRSLMVTWSRLQDSEVQRLFGAGLTAGSSEPVFILPDVDDPVSLFWEAFPANFSPLPRGKFTWAGLGQSGATAEEIIA